MKKHLTIILTLALVFSCISTAFANGEDTHLGENKITASNTLSDVKGTAFETAVENLFSKTIINGYEEGESLLFKPLSSINRAEACKIVVMSTSPKEGHLSDASAAFIDMDGYSWANTYVNYAVSKGIITGYEDGTFRPGANVSYNEMNAMILRALGISNDTLTGIWPTNYADKAIELGLHKGLRNSEDTAPISGEYGSDHAIRGNVAIMIYNVIDNLQKINNGTPGGSNANENNNGSDEEDNQSNDNSTTSDLRDYTGRAYAVINGSSTILNSERETTGQLNVQYGNSAKSVEMKPKLDLPVETDYFTASLFCLSMDSGIVEEYTKKTEDIQKLNSYFKVLAGKNISVGASDFATITRRSDILVHYTEADSAEEQSFVVYDKAVFYVCTFENGSIDGYRNGRLSDLKQGALVKAYTITEDGDGTAQVVIIVDKSDAKYIK